MQVVFPFANTADVDRLAEDREVARNFAVEAEIALEKEMPEDTQVCSEGWTKRQQSTLKL
jgi:hypothetical protein